ncbi:MAG: S-layer homology domain-containing protein [Clostridia bacterium]|nr:S-layer homology domain-containing protein [Clostridia bacterium]
MRNLKKFLALVLATLMVVSAAATVSAFDDVAEDNQYAEAINDLVVKGIVKGVDENNFAPNEGVTRLQMAILIARALSGEVESDELWQNGIAIFPDVTSYAGAIEYANTNGIINGYEDGTFKPGNGVTYIEALTMAIRALGVDTTGLAWWQGYYTTAKNLGLTENVAVYDANKALTRAEVAQVIYNMIYVEPANGGESIAAKNFAVATAANTTTFIVTATEKQAYAATAKVAEAGYVGLQELVNGVPAGSIVYLPVAVLGIENADEYFGYAFDFINYNAKTGAFDKIIPGEEPVVVYNKDLASKSDTKFTFEGVTYYPSESITGAALKNEIVIFNGGMSASASKMLLTNKDGDIVNQTGEVIATFAYETSNGNKYYVDKKQDVEGGSAVVMSEATALAKYGVAIDDSSYTDYDTATGKDLKTGNYQITLFDDDRDGKYERAIVTDVYLAVYNNPDSGKQTTQGPWMTGNDDDRKNVTYTATLTKGTVFTYTYNKQTKVVDVLDVVTPSYGTLTRIDTTLNNGDNKNTIKLTIDGTVYTLANTAHETAGNLGAKLYASQDPGSFAKIASDAKLCYIYDAVNANINKVSVGSPIRYYAMNGYILYAESYSIEESFDRVVLDEIVSYDSSAIYANMYINGVLTEDVAISKIDDNTIASLNIFKLSALLSNAELLAKGNVFRAVKLTDGSYQLSEALDASNVSAFKLTDNGDPYKGKVVFDDGIADGYENAAFINRGNKIRTNNNTIFYFLKKSGNNVTAISTYIGAPDNSSIDFTVGTVELYADKIGYGDGSYNGVSSFVLVYYTDASAIKGFGVANVEYSTVYVVNNGAKVVAYNKASAADLGLTGSAYTGKYFYAYSVSGLAIDMATGASISTIYSEDILTPGQAYKLSSDNVVIGTATLKSAELSKADFVQDRYYSITGIADGTGKDVKITTVKLTKAGKIDVKTDKIGDVLGADKVTVYYIDNFEDGSFVGVAG